MTCSINNINKLFCDDLQHKQMELKYRNIQYSQSRYYNSVFRHWVKKEREGESGRHNNQLVCNIKSICNSSMTWNIELAVFIFLGNSFLMNSLYSIFAIQMNALCIQKERQSQHRICQLKQCFQVSLLIWQESVSHKLLCTFMNTSSECIETIYQPPISTCYVC